MSQRLAGKVAIVTGASKGIGRDIAKVFAMHGAKVIITARNRAALEQTAAEIQGEVITFVGDVSIAAEAKAMAQLAMDRYDRIDILAHNAGIYPRVPLRDMTESQWDEVCDVNLKGTFLTVQACLPAMESQKYGRIVVTSSITGPKVTQAGLAHYAASKGGVNGFIKTAALELARSGITVNGVEPGNIITEGLLETDGEFIKALEQGIPMGKLGTGMDVAFAVLFLASDEAKYITGETIVVDGGQILPESPFLVMD